MTAAFDIPVWNNPTAHGVGNSVDEFLDRLPGPCWIVLNGRDATRHRALATLLHGNEPSGLKAAHRFIRDGNKPAVTCHIFVGAVLAAKTSPRFSKRFLDGKRDLNRCFRPPYSDPEGLLAERALAYLDLVQPESLLDIHNTSGAGPDFAVTLTDTDRHRALAQLFTHRMIVTNLRMGALMEVSNQRLPAITVECGGAQDPVADRTAYAGLCRYLCCDNLFATLPAPSLFEIYEQPFRMELRADTQLEYSEIPSGNADICIPPEIENYNFGKIDQHHLLAWLNAEDMSKIDVRDDKGTQKRDDFFEYRDGALFARQPLRLFMATTRADIAISDCLFYFVQDKHYQRGTGEPP